MCKPLEKVSRIERCSPKTDIWPINASDPFEFLKSPWGAPTNKDLSSMKHASTVGLLMTTWSNLQENLFLQKILGYICRPATNNIYLSQAIALQVSIFYFRRIERHKVLIMKYMLFKNSIHQKYHNSWVVFKLPAKLAIDPKKIRATQDGRNCESNRRH